VSGTITVDIFHTLMWAKDHAPDPNYEEKFLLFRPKHSWQAKLEAASHGTDVRFDARWVGRRYTRKQNTKWLPPYRWFDLSLRREFPWRKLRAIISATCENLTNEPAALLEGYPLPGRSARLSLELRL
jgi:outer membrane receptor protein involved in Fe transport